MKKFCLIINPIAGKGAARKSISEIEQFLNKLDIDYVIRMTEYPGHAIELAEEAGSNGYQTVVAVGGDGTVNEVINGLMHAAKADRLTANVRKIDIGFVRGGDYPEGRYFGNGVGIGFDTVVGFEAAKLPPFISGIPAYLIAAVQTVFLYFNAPLLRVEIDDAAPLEQACLLLSLMNGRRMGGSFMFAPESESDDGQLNLCITEKITRWQVLSLFPKVIGGTQAEHPAIKMPTAERVKITALSGTLPVHADGETICTAGSELEVSILKQQLQLVCG